MNIKIDKFSFSMGYEKAKQELMEVYDIARFEKLLETRKLQQKAYKDGYEKGREEATGYMHKNVCQICKQNRQDEGRMAICMPCYEKELEK